MMKPEMASFLRRIENLLPSQKWEKGTTPWCEQAGTDLKKSGQWQMSRDGEGSMPHNSTVPQRIPQQQHLILVRRSFAPTKMADSLT